MADFVSGMLRTVKQLTGMEIKSESVTTWEITDCLSRLIPGRDAAEIKKLCYDTASLPGWCADIPVYDGAKEAVARLRERYDVHVVTSPLNVSPYWIYERTQWLRTHFDIGPEDITHTHRKYHVGDPGDVLIDDKPEHIQSWTNRGKSAYMWRRSYNADADASIARVSSWAEVEAIARLMEAA